jgi:hypothetical protein
MHMTQATPDPNTPGAPDAGAAEPVAAPPPRASFEQRVEGFGRDIETAAERLGREAEAAGHRLANDPNARRAGDVAARLWGVIVLAIGLWFLADVTFGVQMPSVPWRDVWPLGLILLGGLIVLRGMTRSRA